MVAERQTNIQTYIHTHFSEDNFKKQGACLKIKLYFETTLFSTCNNLFMTKALIKGVWHLFCSRVLILCEVEWILTSKTGSMLLKVALTTVFYYEQVCECNIACGHSGLQYFDYDTLRYMSQRHANPQKFWASKEILQYSTYHIAGYYYRSKFLWPWKNCL